jgi:cysteine desulfuration protein SufE
MTLHDTLETLTLLPDWESRYGYVIELARQLPPMPETDKTETNLVPGCTSQVWLVHTWNNEKLYLHLDSDALIVKGLLAIIHAAFNGKTRAEIAALNLPQLLEPTGLLSHLSPNRRSGFASVTSRIQSL